MDKDQKLVSLDSIMSWPDPTPEEMNVNAERAMAVVRPTLIDNWPAHYREISMRTYLIPFDKECAIQLFEGGPQTLGVAGRDIAQRIDDICGWNWHFFRLNSRSPKDGCFPMSIPVTCSGKEVLHSIASSMRCMDDIAMFYRTEDPLFICLREFVPMMRPEEELRCFVKGGDLLAVAQYGLEGIRFPDDMRQRVDVFFEDSIKPHLPVQDLVFDVWPHHSGMMLIEINPYGLSDPVGAATYGRIEQGIPGIAYRE